MKPLLLASATALAFVSSACAVTAADDDVVHFIGNDDSQSIHINTTGPETVIVVDGQRIEVRDGAVFIDGERHEGDDGRIVVANGTTIRVGDGAGHHFSWSSDGDFEDMAHVEAEIARAMAMAGRIDHDAIHEAHEEARRAVEEAMAELDIEDAEGHRWVIENGERRELTDEERAEVREAMREARDEVREAMREMRIEMRGARNEARNRRVEIRRVERDAARHAERASHSAVLAERHAERAQALRERIHASGARSVRFESDDGEQRVWVDDRELEGDERTEWLNRMQLDELEGGPGEHSYFYSDDDDGEDQDRRVMVFRSAGDGETHEFQTRRHVVIEIDSDDEDGVEVYEFSSDDEEN